MTLCPKGLFDQEIRQRKLGAMDDQLVALNSIMFWGMCRETLESMRISGRNHGKGGRQPIHPQIGAASGLRSLWDLARRAGRAGEGWQGQRQGRHPAIEGIRARSGQAEPADV